MDSQESHSQQNYKRTRRPSLVPNTKFDRWNANSQTRKNEREAKSEDPHCDGRGKSGKDVSKKPPFIVPGIVRPNDAYLKRNDFAKNLVKTPVMNRQPLYLPTPKPVLSHFMDARNKPINSAKHNVLPEISITQSNATSFAPQYSPFVPPAGLKINVEPISILKKSPSRKPEDELQELDDNPWVTVKRGFSLIQEEFEVLGQKMGHTAAPKVSFLHDKSVVNDTFEHCEDSNEEEFFPNSSVVPEFNAEWESERDSASKQKDRSSDNFDLVPKEIRYSLNDEAELSVDSESEPDAQYTAKDIPVAGEGTDNDSSYEDIGETDYSSSESESQPKSPSLSVGTETEIDLSLSQSYEESATPQRNLSVASTEKASPLLELDNPDSDPGSSDEVLRLRERLEVEDFRLTDMCLIWERELEDNVPAVETGNVLTVIRQTQQLLNERFNQYASLIDQFENQTGRKIVLDDMEGFWEMILLQVADVDKKFAELEELKKDDWVRKEFVLPKKVLKKTKIIPRALGVKSNIRSHIAATKKLPKSRRSFTFLGRATPLFRTPVMKKWNITRTRLCEYEEPIPFAGLSDSIRNVDAEAPAEDGDGESFSTQVTSPEMQSLMNSSRKKHNSVHHMTLPAMETLTPVKSSRRKHNSVHQMTSTPQFSSNRKRTTAGTCLESTFEIEDKEQNNNEFFSVEASLEKLGIST